MTRKRIDSTTGKPVDFYARGRALFDAIGHPPVPDIYAQAAALMTGIDMAKPGADRTIGMSPTLVADYSQIEARVLAHYAKENPPVPVTFAQMYGCGGDEVVAFRMAQAPDAPAELRDWFWEAVRRGCSDE